MNNKSTLILSANFYPIEGGIQTYMYELAANWENEKLTVVCYQERNEDMQQDEPFKIRRVKKELSSYGKGVKTLLPLLQSRLGMRFFFLLIKNRWFVRSISLLWNESFKHIDENCVIQCSKPLNLGIIGLAGKILKRSKLVIYIHGSELFMDKKREKLMSFVLNNADLVIANSSYTRSLAEKLGVTKTIDVINLGAKTEAFFPLIDKEKKKSIAAKYDLPQNAEIILTISHLVPRKGHDLVIKAMSQLKRDKLYYLIVGQGDNERNLRELTDKLSLSQRVIFCGFVQNDELNSYMNLCDIFVMPNRKEGDDVEGFGIVFLEANSCGKPVIGGNSGGVVDAVIDGVTGFLVNPHSATELSEKIEYLLNHPELGEEMGQKGLERVKNEFNWENVCKQINRKIDKL